MAGRTAFGECDTCETEDRLKVSQSIKQERVCGFCFEGRAEYGITDREELAVWSLIQRRQKQP